MTDALAIGETDHKPRRYTARRVSVKNDPGKGLDLLRQAFVKAFLTNGEVAVQALITARAETGMKPMARGTSHSYASKILAEPAVAAAIAHRREVAARESQFSITEYYRGVRRLLAQSSGEIPVLESQVKVSEGEDGELEAQVVDVPVYRPAVAGQGKALELMARNLGVFREQVELSGPGGGPVQLAAMSSDQLAARLAELERQSAGALIDGQAELVEDNGDED
jgi:phage terminase small subunit